VTTHQVNWYGEEVKLTIAGASRQLLVEVAHRVEEHTKINITNNNQVDTGFMRNSVYVSAPNESNYNTAKSEAAGRNPNATMGPEATPPNENTVVVAVGAEYAVFQEIQNSFLLLAVEQTAGEGIGREVEVVRKQHGL
jgi:hypothetical protein